MDLGLGVVVFEEVLVAVGVTDNVIEGWLPDPGLDEDSLLVLDDLVELLVLLPQLLDSLNVNVVNRDCFFALGIGIDAIIKQERVVVDDASSVKSFDEEFSVLQPFHVV